MVMLEAVQTNFDHLYNHDRGGITKHDSLVLHSALPLSLTMKAAEKEGVFFFFFFLHLCFFFS